MKARMPPCDEVEKVDNQPLNGMQRDSSSAPIDRE
jgi:hypothetical protein